MSAFGRLMRADTHIDFGGRWRRWFAISGTVILIGLVSLGVRGLNFSIDFKGGTIWQVPTTASVTAVRNAVAKIDSSVASQAEIQVQTTRSTNQRVVQVQAGTKATGNQALINDVKDSLATLAHTSSSNVNVESVGASWGSQITDKAIKAVFIFLIVVGIYIWLRFEGKMAIAALVALVHDILVTIGIYSLSGFQVSPDTVIAFLTILGYSLYDTIVVFDKVQENTKGLASSNRQTYTDMVNLSMNQVLARSINTSFVAIIPILSILVIGAGLLGASTLADFGLALFIGLTTGAYSSIFIASPLLGILKEREPRYKEIHRRIASGGGSGSGGGGSRAASGSRRRPGPTTRPSPVRAGSPVATGPELELEPEAEPAPSEPPTAVFNVRTGPATPAPPAQDEAPKPPAPSPARRPARDGDDALPATPVPPRSVNRPPPRPRKKTRRR
jgi:preprotein translocase subunit SecF